MFPSYLLDKGHYQQMQNGGDRVLIAASRNSRTVRFYQ